MRSIFQRPIPVGLFAIVILLACALYAVSFYRQGSHFKRMDDFMAAGGRFTGAQGEVHESRITNSELEIKKLKQEIKELKNAR